MKTETYTLPAFWACALFYGDYSGLEDEEIEAIEAWQSAASGEGIGGALSVSESPEFTVWHDARPFFDLAADCLEYTFSRQ